MEKITTVGIDLAKNVFSLHGVDALGKPVLRRTVGRDQLEALIAKLPACVIGMEACSGAHEWARRFARYGHTVRLMAPKFVSPYRKSGKNDGNDAEAICEAVSRPSMRFVPVKTVEQQALLTLHRVRQGFVSERTAIINRLRGLLAEFGVVLPLRANTVRAQATAAGEQLPELVRRAAGELLDHLRLLDSRIAAYEHEIESQAKLSEPAQRLMKIRGIGAITALALVASVGRAREFKNGRQFSAWIGLVPRQHSTGGKTRLGHISKHGDPYLRCLLFQGARAVLHSAAAHQDRFDAEIAAVAPTLADYELFAGLPGAGPVFAPRLLAAFGEQRERFASANQMQSYVGVAPVTERSGNKCWVHWRWRCPKFVRQTFVEWAAHSIPYCYWADAYYRQQRAKGSLHQAALRALAFKWIRIVYRCWQTRTPYDEATYLSALKRRGSPLIT